MNKQELKEQATNWAERDFGDGIELSNSYKDQVELEEHLTCYDNSVTEEEIEYFKEQYNKAYKKLKGAC